MESPTKGKAGNLALTPYNEHYLVEQPIIGLFADLGWQTASALEETFDPTGTLGRTSTREVVLLRRLQALSKN